jgi:hypothetical protein
MMVVGCLPVQSVKADETADVWYGDVNDDGKIDAKDVTMLRRHLAGGWKVNINEEKADLNQDDEINAKDVTMLRRFLAGGWGVELPTKPIAFETMPIDDKSFPDDNFRNYVLEKIDTDKDGILSLKEAEDVKNISISINSEIKSLKGIECFSKLEDLTCSFNQITELDLRNNKALKLLNCGCNNLEKLDLSNNVKLEELYCFSNHLDNLNLSKNTLLKRLDFEDNNISKIELSPNVDLEYLYCVGTGLSKLDLSRNTKLTRLVCDEGVEVIRKIEISEDVFEDGIFRNYISGFDIDKDGYLSTEEIKAVNNVDVSETDVESVEGIEAFQQLDSFNCSNTKIRRLTFGDEEEIVISFGSIDASNNPELEELNCWGMKVKSLKISGEKVTEIICGDNKLEELDISGCPNLTWINCWHNNLEKLDLSNNKKLTKNTVHADAKVEIIWYDETAHQDVPEETVHQNIPDFADGYVLCYAGEQSYAAVAFSNYFGHIDLSDYNYDESGKIVGLTATRPDSDEKIEAAFEYTGNINTKTVWLYSTGSQVIWVFDNSGAQTSITHINPNGYTWIQDKDNNITELGGSSEVQFYFTNGSAGMKRENIWGKQAVTDKKYYYNEQRQIVRIDCTNTETNETMIALYEYENDLQVKAVWNYSDGNVLTWIIGYDDESVLSELTYYDTYGNHAEYFMESGSIDSLKLDEATISDIEHYGPYGVLEIPYGRNYGYNISSFLGFSGYEVKYQYDSSSKNLVQVIVSDMGSEKVFTADYEYGEIYMSKAVFTMPDGTKKTYVFDNEGNEKA